jgi:hypothetical protein
VAAGGGQMSGRRSGRRAIGRGEYGKQELAGRGDGRLELAKGARKRAVGRPDGNRSQDSQSKVHCDCAELARTRARAGGEQRQMRTALAGEHDPDRLAQAEWRVSGTRGSALANVRGGDAGAAGRRREPQKRGRSCGRGGQGGE